MFTAFYGRRYDTHGFRRSILPGIALLMAGYLALYFTRDTLPVFFGSLCMMMGYLSSNAIFGAMMRTYTPPEQVGLFQGGALWHRCWCRGSSVPLSAPRC